MKQDWSNRNIGQPMPGPSFARADFPPSPQVETKPAVTVPLPPIPKYQPKATLNPEFAAEVRSFLLVSKF
jgi:hypothetical protein